MTPFGKAVRDLREERGITQKQMAKALNVTPAYLSALEHGHRSKPNWHFVQRIIGYFNIIWDDAEDLMNLAGISDPKITIDTSGLSPKATETDNHLAKRIAHMSDEELDDIKKIIDKT